MVYGREKALQMARSILPSSSPRYARCKRAQLHREARRGLHQQLRRVERDVERAEEMMWRGLPPGELTQMVRGRRSSDKLRHFERWAQRRTAKTRPGDRLGQMAAVLPKGSVIGAHALSHLRRLSHFRSEAQDAMERRTLRAFWFRPPPGSRLSQESRRALVVVEGEGVVTARRRGCCAPVPPEPILASLSPTRGWGLHLASCEHARRAQVTLPAWWPSAVEGAPVWGRLVIQFERRPGLHDQLVEHCASHGGAALHTTRRLDEFTLELEVEVRTVGAAALRSLIRRLKDHDGVVQVHRA